MRTPIIKGEDGKSYIELTNPEDEIQRRLNPTTGTEADNLWPDATPEVPPPPLLDLDVVWSNISDGTLIPTPHETWENAVEDVHVQNANILIRELKYYLLATAPKPPVANKPPSKADSEQSGESSAENKQAEENVDDTGRNTQDKAEKTPPTTEGEPESVEPLKSVYGACILLKLQFEDRVTQKNVPEQDYVQLGDFIANVTQNIEAVMSKNPVAAQAVTDAVALDLTQILLSRMLDGLETCVVSLQNACFELLLLCSKYANPKEMHMALLGFMRKIDKTYMQATCYLVFRPLVTFWTEVLVRIPKKRHAFLLDFVKWYDKASSESEGFESIGVVYDGGIGAEQPGLCDGISDIAIDFYARLAKVQANHSQSDMKLKECVDAHSAALSTFAMSKQKSLTSETKAVEKTSSEPNDEKEPVKGEKVDETKTNLQAPDASCVESDGKNNGENKDTANASEAKEKVSAAISEDEQDYEAEARDLVNERSVTLAQALKLQSDVWNHMAPPKGEEQKVPKQFRKGKVEKREKTKKEGEAEQKLLVLLRTMHNLGWTNPTMVCQVACRGLHLELMTEDDDMLRDHIGNDLRGKKEIRHSLYSTSGIGLFVCGWLRCAMRMSQGESNDEVDEYVVDLTGSGFDLLQAEYALDLVLPYLSSVVGLSTLPICLAGMVTIRAFLERLKDSGFATMEDVMRVRCGTRALGRDVSIYGLALHMGNAIGLIDDPKHRSFVYESLQMVINMCKHPMARYCVVESLVHESTRVAVTAQYVTELKDAIRHSDRVAWGDGEDSDKGKKWTKLDAAELKTRFIELVSGIFLLPRKEMLGKMQGIAATVGAYVYVAGSDARHLEKCVKGEDDDVRGVIETRQKVMREYMKLGREMVRALAAVAEHDQKRLPGSQMARESGQETRAMFKASVQTLNSCVATLGMMDSVVDKLG